MPKLRSHVMIAIACLVGVVAIAGSLRAGSFSKAGGATVTDTYRTVCKPIENPAVTEQFYLANFFRVATAQAIKCHAYGPGTSVTVQYEHVSAGAESTIETIVCPTTAAGAFDNALSGTTAFAIGDLFGAEITGISGGIIMVLICLEAKYD